MVKVWDRSRLKQEPRGMSPELLSPGGDSTDVFEWMLLGVQSVQYFVESQMYHLVCNPVFQSRTPTKEGNEARVSAQVP